MFLSQAWICSNDICIIVNRVIFKRLQQFIKKFKFEQEEKQSFIFNVVIFYFKLSLHVPWIICPLSHSACHKALSDRNNG